MIKFSTKWRAYFFLLIMISLFSIFPSIKADIQQVDQITCTSPTSSTSLSPGDTTYITWITTGQIFIIQIDIYNGNVLKYTLEETFNDGSLKWRVPYTIEMGSDWRVKISDYDDYRIYDWSDYFKITLGESILVKIIIAITVVGVVGVIGIVILINYIIKSRRYHKKLKEILRKFEIS